MTRGTRIKWSTPRTRDTHTYCRAFCSGAVNTCFYDISLDSNTQPSACGANALTHCATAAAQKHLFKSIFGGVITGERLQMSYARHSWPLRSDCPFTCHAYCDTCKPFNSHLRGPVTFTPAEHLAVELSLSILTT